LETQVSSPDALKRNPVPSLNRMRALMQIATDIIDLLSTKTQNRAEAEYIVDLVKNAVEWRYFVEKHAPTPPERPQGPNGDKNFLEEEGTQDQSSLQKTDRRDRPWTDEEEEIVIKSLRECHPYVLEGLRNAARQLGRSFTCVKQHYYFRMKPKMEPERKKVIGTAAGSRNRGAKQPEAELRKEIASLKEENARLKAERGEAAETLGLYFRAGNRLVKDLYPDLTSVRKIS
jgi:uncharacterized small protein (DUF1192 family)